MTINVAEREEVEGTSGECHQLNMETSPEDSERTYNGKERRKSGKDVQSTQTKLRLGSSSEEESLSYPSRKT